MGRARLAEGAFGTSVAPWIVAGVLLLSVSVTAVAQEATPASVQTASETNAKPAADAAAATGGAPSTVPAAGVGPADGGSSWLALGAGVGAAVAAASALRERLPRR